MIQSFTNWFSSPSHSSLGGGGWVFRGVAGVPPTLPVSMAVLTEPPAAFERAVPPALLISIPVLAEPPAAHEPVEPPPLFLSFYHQ